MTGVARRSFRDPAGGLFEHEGRVLRVVFPAASPAFLDLCRRPVVASLVRDGALVETVVLDDAESERLRRHLGAAPGSAVVEHPALEFPSYPYEWPPEMLLAAGLLTLEIAERLHADGLGLKDATPYNVLFRGGRPVFVDVASLEQREPGDSTWLPYAQFVRTFVLPLLVRRRFGVPLQQVFLAHRDGLDPEAVYAMAGWLDRLRPSMLLPVSLPTWLGASARPGPARRSPPRGDPEAAGFVLRASWRRLRRQLERSAPRVTRSAWSDYPATSSYEADDLARKRAFVAEALQSRAPRRVLDVGCNTGQFSEQAAATGATVVAIDADEVSVGHVWRRANAGSPAIQPLVANLARPSPGLGWRCGEQKPLLERLAGRFDMVLMLAVVHHLVVSEGIPLADVLALAAELTRDRLVIEYVGPGDPMFRILARGRDALHAHLTVEHFEAACRSRFEILRSLTLDNGRRLYLLARVPARGGDAL